MKHSIFNKLMKEGKVTDDLLILLNSLTIEELIFLKLESAARLTKNKLYGLNLLSSMKNIVESAVIGFAYSACRSKAEAASFLGTDPSNLSKLIKKYKIKTYFQS